MENKSAIFNALIAALKLTKAWDEISDIRYDEVAQVVEITYNGITNHQSVWGDSGIAFIRDIIKNLEE